MKILFYEYILALNSIWQSKFSGYLKFFFFTKLVPTHSGCNDPCPNQLYYNKWQMTRYLSVHTYQTDTIRFLMFNIQYIRN